MIRELLSIYDTSRTNPDQPECTFAETLLFSEGWLLRGVLQEWQRRTQPARFLFLPFPDGITVYSEAQLYTPFKARFLGDKQAEGHTHVDGIVGDFQIEAKSGVVLDRDFGLSKPYLTVFEAKMYSALAKGVKRAPDYDQVSRTVACMIHAILESGSAGDRVSHLVVLHPADSIKIHPDRYTAQYVKGRIAARARGYLAAEGHDAPNARFFAEWRDVLPQILIQFLTWEDVLAEIDSDELNRFYALCVQFNRS